MLLRKLLKRDDRIVGIDNHATIYFVICLLCWGSPSDISRSIVSVDSDAIKRATRWPFADVRKKRRWIIQPLIAHPNSTSSIIFILCVSLSYAARFRMLPCPKFGRRFVPKRITVRDASLADKFCSKASATRRQSGLERVAMWRGAITAITDTDPFSMPISAIRTLKNNEPSEPLSS